MINDSKADICDTIPEKSMQQLQEVRSNPVNHISSNISAASTSCNESSQTNKSNNSMVNSTKVQCMLKRKVIIPPQKTVYSPVISNYIPADETIFFDPSITDAKGISTYKAIVKAEVNKQKNSKSSNCQFYIPITNNSDSQQHINKGTVIGHIYQIDEIQDDFEDNSSSAHHNINLIQASEDILKLRKAEFNIKSFNTGHLSNYQRNSIQNLLQKFYPVFSSSLRSIGHTDHIKPHINFTSDVPVKTLPYPVPESIQEEIKNQLDALQEAGIIERSISEWACPMLSVKKKTAPGEKPSFRLALDLRLINTMIRSSAYPLPRIDHIINNISKFKYFTTLDFPSAYHQIDLPEEYRRRLSFTTQWGTFSFSRLMFGLRSAASSFQMLVDAIIEESKQSGIFAYQDDIIVGSNSFQETIDKLTALFKVLKKYNLTISPKKSQFHQNEIQYLGFHIKDHTISPISSNIKKINEFPLPKTRKHLKRFIGICSFYRKIIPAFSFLMEPLIKLTSPKSPFKWTDDHTIAFKKIQQIFFKQPFLNLPDWSKQFVLNTDASNTAIAGVLLQQINGSLLPVSYFSKTLTPSEQRYPAIKKELMAIVKSIDAFKYFLYNRNFMILSDSKPIEHFKKITSPVDLTTKWLIELYNYDFTFKYIKGKSNVLADYLSREDLNRCTQDLTSNPELINQQNILPITTASPTIELNHLNDDIDEAPDSPNNDPKLQISLETFFNEQSKDVKIQNIIKDITSNQPTTKFQNYFINPDTGLLMIKKKFHHPENSKSCKIVVPKKLIYKVLKICHMPHIGIHNTYRKVLQNFYWKGVYKDTKNYVISCHLCITCRPHRIPAAPLQEMFIPQMPGELVSMDFLGPFPNHMHILSFIDHFSKHVELFRIRNITSQSVVKSLTKYITTYGRPAVLMSDLGSQFTAKVFNDFIKTLNIGLVHSSSAHPQTQGSSERINTAIKSSIAALTKEGYNFEQAMMIHKNIYNTTVHSSTGYTPAFLHFGRSISNIFDLFQPTELQAIAYPYEYYSYMSSLEKIYNKVYENMKEAQHARNARQHQKASLRKFQVNDLVYLKSNDTFKSRFLGPYIVVNVISDVLLSIKDFEKEIAQPFNINIDRLLLAQRRKPHLLSPVTKNNKKNIPAATTSLTDNNQPDSPPQRYNLRPRK